MLFVGDDWAEDHHDVEVMDATGRTLAKARLPEGVAGIARLHAMIGERIGQDATDGAGQVTIGIETDRGPWVQALIAAGYVVLAVNPLQAARYRERLGVSGAKSDTADAHMLADMVRTDAHQLRPVAADSAQAEAVKVVTRLHKTLIWERTRASQRLRHALREYFPAALAAFDDLDAADTLEVLARAPDPASAARMAVALSGMFLRRARLSAADTCARVSRAALAGSGALPSSSSASGASRSSNASSAAGKYSRSWCRSRCTARVRSQIIVLCIRAVTLTASASGESPAAWRSWWESVRTMPASMCASPPSLLAPDTPCRSR